MSTKIHSSDEMLATIRSNITRADHLLLEYLQNERPALYEKVRQSIVMFEVAGSGG